MNPRRLSSALFLIIALLILFYPSFAIGTITIRITDSGEKLGDSMHIRCKNLALHRMGEGETVGWITLINQTDRYDLIGLSNITEIMVRSRITIGRYDRIRFTVSEATVTVNGTDTKLGVRAEQVTIALEFSVASGETVVIVDFRTNFKQTIAEGTFRASPTAYVQT